MRQGIRRSQGVATNWKISETSARGRLKLIERDAKDGAGEPMLCECKSPLDAYDLLREAERPKTVLCCRKPSCDNSAQETARIFRLELIAPKEEG